MRDNLHIVTVPATSKGNDWVESNAELSNKLIVRLAAQHIIINARRNSLADAITHRTLMKIMNKNGSSFNKCIVIELIAYILKIFISRVSCITFRYYHNPVRDAGA